MRSQIWRGILGVAVVACLVGETIAQDSGPLAGLDELLGKQKNLTTFHTYLKRYPQILEGVKEGDGITILAPDNAAMEKIPSSILKVPFETNNTNEIVTALRYHVLKKTLLYPDMVEGLLQNSETLLTDPKHLDYKVTYFKSYDKVVTFITGLGTRCTLLTPDLKFGNGIVHIIDSPIITPQEIVATTSQYNLTSFQGALFAGKKIDEINKAKGLTIFVPQNAAFQALGSAISTMTVEQLAKVLSYHIVTSGTTYSPSLKNDTVLTTSTGQKLQVRVFGNLMFVNSAQVTEKDILIANGVMHTIDAVLNPKDAREIPNPDIAMQKPVFASATPAANVPFTSAIPCSTACTTTANGKVTGVVKTSSKAVAPRETGFAGAFGLAAAVVGGAVMMI